MGEVAAPAGIYCRAAWSNQVRQMKTFRLALLASTACLPLLGPSSSPAQQVNAPEQLEVLETALIIGVMPGPALWKVTSRNNTLWILPVFGPLPDRLDWKSREVEEVIRDSQAVYVGGRAIEGGSARSAARALRALSNVEGKLLLDVLPEDLHQRFAALSRRYAGNTARFEQYRPYYATEALRETAMTRLGLASDGEVVARVTRLARQHGVKVHAIEATADRARERIIAQLEATPREADVPCVRVMLDRLELDLRESIERANAWSRGDLEALRGYTGLRDTPRFREACGPFLRHMDSLGQQDAAARRSMYSTYSAALRRNRSTLALVWASELLSPDGLIARFRRAGYEVIEPRQAAGNPERH